MRRSAQYRAESKRLKAKKYRQAQQEQEFRGLLPSRLRFVDVLSVGSLGLKTRKVRTVLSALGITIGIAAMVGVLGISESSGAALKNQIESLGTNLLVVSPSGGFGGGDGVLPDEAVGRVARVGPVRRVADVVEIDQPVLRNDVMNPNETGGISAMAADLDLLETLNGDLYDGVWLDETRANFPVVVLGAVTAQRLGIERVAIGEQNAGVLVLIGDEWFTVVGILKPFPKEEDLDRAAFIGKPIAKSMFESELNPSTIYVRTNPAKIDDVRRVIQPTVDPQSPDEVSVSRPSDLLQAQEATDDAFTGLFLGLGAVSLLVGGVGIANVMVIAVIERRNEIGLRRALGATQPHIRRQFLTEALILSAIGGVAGILVGILITALYARAQGWDVVIPLAATGGGMLAALFIGALAGLYPAMRAARLAPTEALRST